MNRKMKIKRGQVWRSVKGKWKIEILGPSTGGGGKRWNVRQMHDTPGKKGNTHSTHEGTIRRFFTLET